VSRRAILGAPAATLLVMALLTASCADAVDPHGGASRNATADDHGLVAACGGVEFADLHPDTSAFAPYSAWGEIDLAPLGGEAPFFREFIDQYAWFTAEETADSLTLFGEPRHGPRGSNPYASAALEMRDGAWFLLGWGQCSIELSAPGWGNARFMVDPTVPPDPGSDRVTVFATEMACAGGKPPGDRRVRSVVVEETAESVSVVLLVERTQGDTSCPGNPRFQFEIALDSPIGDREILDASVYPAEVRWPRS
jgi:hypothetical protein